MYIKRDYRRLFQKELDIHYLAVSQTDLAIGLSPGIWDESLERRLRDYIYFLRSLLEDYININPDFALSHKPIILGDNAPPMALAMAKAANMAGVGPMAAVAGAFARAAGEFLLAYSGEVFVENGGDIFLAGSKERLVGIFAGQSPFSGKIALQIDPAQMPLGICTSSGTVGPSISYGQADAVTILAKDTLLADAVATAAANLIQNEGDLEKAVNFAGSIKGVSGALAIKNQTMAAWGEIRLVPLKNKTAQG